MVKLKNIILLRKKPIDKLDYKTFKNMEQTKEKIKKQIKQQSKLQTKEKMKKQKKK